MSASSFSPRAGDTPWDADPQFNIMVPCAGFETGQRAKRIHDRLLTHLQEEFNPVLSLWRLDVLNDDDDISDGCEG